MSGMTLLFFQSSTKSQLVNKPSQNQVDNTMYFSQRYYNAEGIKIPTAIAFCNIPVTLYNLVFLFNKKRNSSKMKQRKLFKAGYWENRTCVNHVICSLLKMQIQKLLNILMAFQIATRTNTEHLKNTITKYQ